MPFAPPKHRPPGMKPEAQRRREYDKAHRERKMAANDAAWKRCRALFLQRHPRCIGVFGRACGAPATDVDHVLSVRDRPDLRLQWENLRPLCKSCHSRRTAKEQGFANPAMRHYDTT
jgi:5-methylcytosine-specific restriction enzyme A